MTRPVSETKRLALGIVGRRRWDRTPIEVREERAVRARATHDARYPHRARLYADLKDQLSSGRLQREPCDTCGGEAAMRLAYNDEAETVEIFGWRCYPCRKAST